MLKDQNGNDISPIQALDFLYKSTRNLPVNAEAHDQLKAAYLLILEKLKKEE
jgi:hypothetical protein